MNEVMPAPGVGGGVGDIRLSHHFNRTCLQREVELQATLNAPALYLATAEPSVYAWEGHEEWVLRGSLAFAVTQGCFLTLISSVELGKVSV